MTENKSGVSGVMSPTRGVFAGGNTPSGRVDTIEYITIASTGNAVLLVIYLLMTDQIWVEHQIQLRGYFWRKKSKTTFIFEYITIATLGDATDFGDLTQSGMDGDVGAVSNSTRVVLWWWFTCL